MKRFALLAALAVACTTTYSQAQVIGTYRPSLVTYYPSATSVTPVAYYKPIPTQYASNVYATNTSPNYPLAQAAGFTTATVPAPQAIHSTPIVQTSYYGAAAYGGGPQVAYSPIGGDCCTPYQSSAATSYYPAGGCAPIQSCCSPVAYQQPAYAPVQTIAYQQPVVAPVQPIGAPQPGLIDGKWYVGKGLLGRPKLYAEGQPIRNTLRTILP